MKFRPILLIMVAAWCALPLIAQDYTAPDFSSDDEQKEETIPDWLVELSNLPQRSRQIYTGAFAAAKQAYAKGYMVDCIAHLNTCELYTRKNPHVWNLRASALIAQKRFDEALPLLEQVKAQSPSDSVLQLNYSLLYLGKGEYDKCIEVTDALMESIRYKKMEGLTHSLLFRKFLCRVMQERIDEARELVKHISPIDDSPLYYYCEAVFALIEGNRREAMKSLNVADSIYSGVGMLANYKQAMTFSGVSDKYSLENQSSSVHEKP